MKNYLAVFAVVMLSATTARAQTPKFEITPDTAVIDERISIVVSGLQPRQEITLRVTGQGGGVTSSATFRADAGGRIDLAKAAPVSGAYIKPHPMGLFWTLVRDTTIAPRQPLVQRQAAPRMPPAQPWVLTAEVGGRVVAADTVWRRAAAPGVRIEAPSKPGVVGHLYIPEGAGPHPVLIVLPGSQGGIPGPFQYPSGFASHGYAALALGYFNAEGLPQYLENIPLEYFARAIDWLKHNPAIDSTRIGVFGGSRGGELALLLGATYPSLRVVIANVPSHVIWPGLSNAASDAPAWTLDSKPLPGMPPRFKFDVAARLAGCSSADNCPAMLGVHRFRSLLEDPETQARAAIPVERINGPVMLISGKDDMLWPSAWMADRVVERLKTHKFKHPVLHLSYEDAGHVIGRPYSPTMDVQERRRHNISGRINMMGGTPEGTALASEDSWKKILEFLDTNLKR